jgi:hypothetical protein
MKQVSLTNIFLAVIAFCLVFNLLVNGNLISKAQAQQVKSTQPIEVMIVGVKNSAGSLPVSIDYGSRRSPIAVNVLQIDGKYLKEAPSIKVVQQR